MSFRSSHPACGEDSYAISPWQLGCTPEELRQSFSKPSHLGWVPRIVSGEPTKAGSDTPYPSTRIDTVWYVLEKLNCNSELEEAIREHNSSEATGLARKLFGSPTMTLTGRVRGRVSFTAAQIRRFQAWRPTARSWPFTSLSVLDTLLNELVLRPVEREKARLLGVVPAFAGE